MAQRQMSQRFPHQTGNQRGAADQPVEGIEAGLQEKITPDSPMVWCNAMEASNKAV